MRRAPSPLSPLGLGLVLLFATPPFTAACARTPFNPLHLQSSATITGKIVDQNNAVVSGARVTARNIATSIENGVDEPFGLPKMNIAGGLNFGGPVQLPQGRGDTTVVLADSLNYLRGQHSLKLGGEYRQFYNNNFLQDSGLFNFPSVAAFIRNLYPKYFHLRFL